MLKRNSCAEVQIAYNTRRNRHCPKCQASTAKRWLADRQAELLPLEYYRVVFTLPAQIADITYQNSALVYDLLFKVTSQTLSTISRDCEAPHTYRKKTPIPSAFSLNYRDYKSD